METPSRFNIKKIFLVVILSIILFIVAATLSRNIHRRKQKRGGNREKSGKEEKGSKKEKSGKRSK
jgi:putative effector of murein hydrolase LrgA (UPF0299 family)